MTDRQELLHNAIAFLNDPKTQASTLAQRIQFLESKGLTPQEIDYALKQSNSGHPYTHSFGYTGHPLGGTQAPWDWRDYFITGIVSGAVAYGAVSLFKKFLAPHLQPPSATAYEEDRDALTAQFDAAEVLLKEIQAESAAVRAAVEEQQQQIEQTTKEVNDVVKEMRDGESRTRDEMREIRDEISTIHEMIPKMIERNKENQSQTLAELQQELKSVRALLLSRGPSAPSGATSPLPVIGRPTIPAWQLTGGSNSPLANGKAKETEVGTSSQ